MFPCGRKFSYPRTHAYYCQYGQFKATLCHVCFGNDVVDVESRELTKDDTGCTL